MASLTHRVTETTQNELAKSRPILTVACFALEERAVTLRSFLERSSKLSANLSLLLEASCSVCLFLNRRNLSELQRTRFCDNTRSNTVCIISNIAPNVKVKKFNSVQTIAVNQTKSPLCTYTRGITLKRVTIGEVHLRGLAPEQHSLEETSQRLAGDSRDIVSDSIGPGIKPKTFRAE